MSYASAEFKKIIKSPIVWAGSGLGILVLLFLFIGLKVKGANPTSLQFVSMALGNLSNLGMFQLISAITAGIAFASEYTYGTLRYLLIRPVKPTRIYAAKLAACFVYILLVTGVLFFLSSVLGKIGWGGNELYDVNGAVLEKPVLRILLFYLSTYINQFFIIALTLLFSFLLRNQGNAILTAYALYVLILIFVPESAVHLSPKAGISLKEYFITPTIQYTELFFATAVTLAYTAVLIAVSVFYLIRRKHDETVCV